MIHYRCRVCGASQSKSEGAAGLTLPCTACREPLLVPASSTAETRPGLDATQEPLPERIGRWAGLHAGPEPAEVPGTGRAVGRFLLGLLFAGLGALALCLGGLDLPELLSSGAWIKAEGVVVSAKAVSDEVTYRRRTTGSTYTKSENHRTVVKYRFKAGGAEVEGSRPTFGAQATYWMLSDTSRQYPKGKKVEVWHDPADPTASTLSRSLSFTSCLILLVGLGIAWAALRLLAAAVIAPFAGKDSLWSPASLRLTWPDLFVLSPAMLAAILGVPILFGF
ncbi:MAG: DUF3592 domain-containing protein [Gemmataceae bacterium]|nr:DUF3592 domain-containing protein [Gemmataceae bacterium]